MICAALVRLVVYDEGEDSNGEWIVAGREGAKGVGLVPGNYVEVRFDSCPSRLSHVFLKVSRIQGADGTDAPQEPEPGPEPEPAPTPTAADVSRASAKSADARNVKTWNATVGYDYDRGSERERPLRTGGVFRKSTRKRRRRKAHLE